MRLHPNAKLTPVARRLLVDRIEKLGWPVARAARAAGVSRQTAYKWLNRFKESGESGLRDRCCRPHRIPVRTPKKLIRRMGQLRRRKKAGWEISQELGDRNDRERVQHMGVPMRIVGGRRRHAGCFSTGTSRQA